MATSDYNQISQRTQAWAAKEHLKHAEPVALLDKFGLTKPLPRNKADTMKFRRVKPLNIHTTALQEGVTPTPQKIEYENVTVNIKQYGDVIEITDQVEDLAEDPVLKDCMEVSGEQAMETKEVLCWDVVKGGTSVIYSTGSSRSAVNEPLDIGMCRKAVRQLKSNRAKMITKMIGASVKYNTEPVAPAFVAVAHTDVQPDIEALSAFTRVEKYGDAEQKLPHEIGKVGEIRFCLSPVLTPFQDADASPTGGSVDVLSTGGSAADVYPIVVFGKEAYGHVPLKGAKAVRPTVINPGKIEKSDPLGQRGYVGWKCYYVAVRLNENWMVRLEVAATEDPTS